MQATSTEASGFNTDAQSIDGDGSLQRTAIPSAWKQMKALMGRNWTRDRKMPTVWAARTFLGPLMVMLYTVGFMMAYEDSDDGTRVGDYILYKATDWAMPQTIHAAGNNPTLLQKTEDFVNANYNSDPRVSFLLESAYDGDQAAFAKFCEDEIGGGGGDDLEKMCVYVDINIANGATFDSITPSNLDVETTIYYGGGESVAPYTDSIAATQALMHSALWNVTSSTDAAKAGGDAYASIPFPITRIERIPSIRDELTADDTTKYIGMTIGILISFSMVLTAGYLISPLVTEKVAEIHLAFVRVGVHLRTYVLQWVAYYSINGILSALTLTAVTILWKLYPKSSAVLIFASHYLALIHLYCGVGLSGQMVSQEEMAQSIPFMSFIISMIIAVPLILFDAPQELLSGLTVLSPFIGIVNYSMIYYKYDSSGFDTGVNIGDNVMDSGLLGAYIGSVGGIVLYLVLIAIYCSPRLRRALRAMYRGRGRQGVDDSDDIEPIDSRNMEPLTGRDEVLLNVRGLMHTYQTPFCKRTKPVEVLRGLDMDVCRGSVLGLLGHNGSGKSTTIRILSGEQELQDGQISYNFHHGNVKVTGGGSMERLQGKIGVCPQHNNLLGDETCRETLRLIATLRGDLPMEAGQSEAAAIEAEVNRLIQQVRFTSAEDADKPVKTYSGGMKRKVCIAIALLGNPEVVFLDEPTAGIDPYNRRTIWDMIIEAKRGRSIILCSHHLEEVDLLSDRVAILKKGRIITAGTALFLKHHFGVGYTLQFDSDADLDIASMISDAKQAPVEKPGTFNWHLSHGSEPSFPQLLTWLEEQGATNIEVELTTLEQVFLATGKEGSESGEDSETCDDDEQAELNLDNMEERQPFLSKVWRRSGLIRKLTFWDKFFLISRFMMQDAWRQSGAIALNITFPLAYMVGGIIAIYLIGEPDEVTKVNPTAIPMTQFLLGDEESEFFGLGFSALPFPIIPANSPASLDDYFNAVPVAGGYWSENTTLQFNQDLSGFALQVGEWLVARANFNVTNDDERNIDISIQQLPYNTEEPFRVDYLVLPIALVFGFTGLVFSMLDILTLKANNIVALFRVAGINEWTVYMGVMYYKCITTFVPFFIIAIVMGFSFEIVLFGNGGRWVASLLMMALYAYSATPMGLIIAKKFITKDFDQAKGWFPNVYFTVVSLPYVAWNVTSQLVTQAQAQDALLIVGDFLCLIPPVAFQRGLGAIINVSIRFDDEQLSWVDVFKFETRVILSSLLMFVVGTFEWIYLKKITAMKPAVTPLKEDDKGMAIPDEIRDADVEAEKNRAMIDEGGISSREIVKVFPIESSSNDAGGSEAYKRAVKGVSFGVQKNEIFVLLGPNGAGKTTLMSVIAGEFSPEHGSALIDGRFISAETKNIDHVFERNNISWCPQHDSLFPGLTVQQHLEFYARVRGLDWNDECTKEHVNAIIRLLGLRPHIEKRSPELSGGYKRRLSLGISMVGYPSSMMIDECTTGLDPGARHLVWSALKPDLVDEEYELPAILFSTHYMDEASELATRIGIMIDGELVATGSLDRLQQRYCRSYFVEIALHEDAADSTQSELIDVVKSSGMEATVYESLPYKFKLQIPFSNSQQQSVRQLASIFDLLESYREQMRIKFYSVAQMNLEQIFIDLSKKQFALVEE